MYRRFYASKTLKIHVNVCDVASKYRREFFSAMVESWKKLMDSKMYFRRLLCVRIEIDQLHCVNC